MLNIIKSLEGKNCVPHILLLLSHLMLKNHNVRSPLLRMVYGIILLFIRLFAHINSQIEHFGIIKIYDFSHKKCPAI